MKFDQSAQWFMRKTCFNILMGIQYERPLDSVNFYRSNISIKYNDLFFNSSCNLILKDFPFIWTRIHNEI